MDVDILDVISGFNGFDEEECKRMDDILPDKLINSDDLVHLGYYISYGKALFCMPKTRKKINQILKDEIKDQSISFYDAFSSFDCIAKWADEDTTNLMIKRWLVDKENNELYAALKLYSMSRVVPECLLFNRLDIFNRLIDIYKGRRSNKIVECLGELFTELDGKDVISACDILYKTTPAVSVALLKREDIPDKYIIKGLKSLSKLSKQKDIGIKVDFNSLQNLGPKSRIDAMEQLLGMCNAYYKWKIKFEDRYASSWCPYTMQKAKRKYESYKLSFKEIPSKQAIEKFLFPCSIKYNKKVVELIKRFDEIIKEP